MCKRIVFAFATALLIVGCGGGGTSVAQPTASAPQSPQATATAAATPAAATPAAGLAQFSGNWRFTSQDVRLNHAIGNYVGATLTVSGGKVTIVSDRGGGNRTSAEASIFPIGDHALTCSASSCGASTLAVMGFVPAGSVFHVVNRATLERINAGAGTCDAPAVPDAGVIKDFNGTKFTFINGSSGGFGSPCRSGYQILWTVVATKI